MSSATNKTDLGSAMMDAIDLHSEIKFIADTLDQLDPIANSTPDETVKQLCQELNQKLLELSAKLIAHILEDAGF